MGCFGCGCLVLVILGLLLAALFAASAHFFTVAGNTITSSTPTDVKDFDGGAALYQEASQKMASFENVSRQNQPATLELSADEINTLIARSPDLAANNISIFITMTGDQARLQATAPTSLLPFGLWKGRFINIDMTFNPSFDSSTKSLNLILHSVRIGNQDLPANSFSLYQEQFNPFLNTQLRRDPDLSHLLDHARSVEIRNGVLTVQTD